MGTSLSGLTPATTFDGLLKVGDNDPLTADLKAISTGDGTDTMLELSTTALQIGGDTGMYWDNTNKRLGIGTDSPATTLQVNGAIRISGAGTQILEFSNASVAQFRSVFGSTGFRVGNSGGVFVGSTDGGPASSTRFHIKGSGTTSATTSLLVQNSAGTDALKVQDDGAIDFGLLGLEFSNDGSGGTMSVSSDRYIKLASSLNTYSALNAHVFKTLGSGGYSEAMRITGNTDQFVGIGETTPTARLHVKGSGNDNTTTSLLVQNSDGTDIFKVQDDGITTFGQNDQSGSTPTGIEFQPNPLNATWGPSIKSYYNNNKWLQIEKGARYYTFADSGLGINMNATPTARLQVKGSGTTAATTALLVQNSAGTDLFKVLDGGADKQVRMNSALIGSLEFLGTSIATGGGNPITMQYNPLHIGGASGAELAVKGSGNDATTTALLVQNSDGRNILSVSDDGHTLIGDTSAQGYAANLTFIRASGGTRGANFYQNNNDFILTNPNGGFKVDGIQTTLVGSGTTSATTALLVQNSAGTELMKVTDGGPTYIKSAVFTTSTQFRGYVDANNNSNLNFIVPSSGNSFVISKSYNPSNDASALLDVQSTTQGFLPPRMTTTERDLISTPSAGLMVYNTTTNKAQCYNGSTWNDLF